METLYFNLSRSTGLCRLNWPALETDADVASWTRYYAAMVTVAVY